MTAAPRIGGRDWPVLVLGVVLGAVAVVLVVVARAQILELPTCDSISGNIDGTGGSPCRDGLEVASWPNDALVPLAASVPLVAMAVVALALGRRRR